MNVENSEKTLIIENENISFISTNYQSEGKRSLALMETVLWTFLTLYEVE